MTLSPSLRGDRYLRRGAKILGEMSERARHRIRHEAAERAKGTEFHRVAEVFEHREICRAILAANDAVDRLHAAGRADPAGRALAARFDGAELHREPGLLRHVHSVVEHHDAAVADQAVARGEGLVV